MIVRDQPMSLSALSLPAPLYYGLKIKDLWKCFILVALYPGTPIQSFIIWLKITMNTINEIVEQWGDMHADTLINLYIVILAK